MKRVSGNRLNDLNGLNCWNLLDVSFQLFKQFKT